MSVHAVHGEQYVTVDTHYITLAEECAMGEGTRFWTTMILYRKNDDRCKYETCCKSD